MSRLYSVINMDIMNSRNIKDRESIQNTIKVYLNSISQNYQSILVAPITMTLGDEWQIVLRDISESYNIFKEIQLFLKEHDINNDKLNNSLFSYVYCGLRTDSGVITLNQMQENLLRNISRIKNIQRISFIISCYRIN